VGRFGAMVGSMAKNKPRRALSLLRAAMEQRGESLADVGRACGVTKQAVHYWLAGAWRPALPTMVRLREVYGIEVEAWL
jgi:transcriptional regulator with XRE-family HTH domain